MENKAMEEQSRPLETRLMLAALDVLGFLSDANLNKNPNYRNYTYTVQVRREDVLALRDAVEAARPGVMERLRAIQREERS